MDSLLPLSKKKVAKKSTLKTREFLAQIKEDITSLFCSMYETNKFKKLNDFKHVPPSKNDHLSTIIYLVTHLLTPVHVSIYDINVRIIPIAINLTNESFQLAEKEKAVDTGRIAVYFLYEDNDGNLDFSTCLIGAIRINNKEEVRQGRLASDTNQLRQRKIEF